MPIIPLGDWWETYGRLLSTLLDSVPLSRITLGSICSYPLAQRLMELKLGRENAVSRLLQSPLARNGRGAGGEGGVKSPDGRLRCSHSTREEVYRYLIGCIRQMRPGLDIGLCLANMSETTAS